VRSRSSSRERIMNAAEQVVLKEGATHMTLDAVAFKAGVSKGGLMYHFPSQDALLRAMMQRFIERMETRQADIYSGLPKDAARGIVAYILSWFSLCEKDRRIASALLAAATRAPELMSTAKDAYRRTLATLINDRMNPERRAIIALATDGMWLMGLLGMQPFTVPKRKRIKAELLNLAREWCGVENDATARKARTRHGSKTRRQLHIRAVAKE